jgi:hypothetical protein
VFICGSASSADRINLLNHPSRSRKFFRTSLLRYAAVLDHIDVIRLIDKARAVARQDGGSAGHQPIQRGDDQRLAVGLDTARWLVEQQDVGVGQKRAGDADALLLPAGKTNAALADVGVVAARELHDELVGIRRFCGGDHLLHRRFAVAVADVVDDAVVEEERLLLDQGKVGTEATLLIERRSRPSSRPGRTWDR